MHEMIYFEAVEIWVSGEKNSIPQDIGKAKKCTFFTLLELAQPECTCFRPEVGDLGEVDCFFLIKWHFSKAR